MNWDDLRIFLAVARAASLSAAATRLAINQSTVSRRMASLERDLDCRLIERGALGHRLTARGAALLREIETMETAADSISRRIAGSESRLSGDLRLACVDMMVDQLLAPLLKAFATRYPAIRVILVSALSAADLARREADVAIRVSKAPPESLIGRRLCGFGLAAYAAPSLLMELGARRSPDSLDWIGWEDPAQEARTITESYPQARIRHRADGFLSQRALVRAGLGASVFPCYWADVDPGLARLYPNAAPVGGQDLWLLAHPDLRQSAKVRAFLDMATSALLAERRRFEGHAPLDAG